MSLYERVAELPLAIDHVEFERRSLEISPQFTRVSSVVKLVGKRGAAATPATGTGEDVTYDAAEHSPDRLAVLDLGGEWTIDAFSKHLEGIELFPAGDPAQTAARDYRRWAIESAALDLALLQAAQSLPDVLGRPSRPLRFVSSTHDPLAWLVLYPELRFKLDATAQWTDELVAGLAASDRVDVVDLKGAYHGTPVDQPPDPQLYRRIAEGLPDAWIEDPALTAETAAVLEPFRERITWDAPIHSFADVEALPYMPRMLNSKPSRFGTLERLFEFYARCEQAGIALYGGGQFELAVGRDQIQLLASIFHPDGPNDVAPGGYNAREPQAGLALSPLEVRAAPAGFRQGER
jgi:hypothetical protein